MDNKFVETLRQCVKDAHETFEATMDGVTHDVAHYNPAGKALPIGALYAHVIISEDWMVQGIMQKKPLLFEGEWGAKAGVSEPMPVTGGETYQKWAESVKVDLKKLKEYAKTVYSETDAYLSTLSDADLLQKEISFPGLPETYKLGRFIIRFLISHVDAVGGEISATKGLQGLKGYPF